MEARYDDLLDAPRRGAVRHRQQRRRRLRRRAHAAISAASTVGVRGRRPWPTSRGDARLNLDILGRLGRRSSRWPTRRRGSCTAREVTAPRSSSTRSSAPASSRRSPGLHETIVADVNARTSRSWPSTCRAGLSADTPQAARPVLEAAMTVTLAAPKVPLVLPPAEHVAGDVVIADIGIPTAVDRGGRGAATRAADAASRCGRFVQPRAPTPTRATAAG